MWRASFFDFKQIFDFKLCLAVVKVNDINPIIFLKKGLYNILKNDLVAMFVSKKKSSLFKPIVVNFFVPGNGNCY